MQSVCRVSNVPVLFQSLNGSSGSSSFFPTLFLLEDDVSSVMWLGRKRDNHDREPARRRRRMRDGRHLVTHAPPMYRTFTSLAAVPTHCLSSDTTVPPAERTVRAPNENPSVVIVVVIIIMYPCWAMERDMGENRC